ncbi:MAG: polymerase, sigma-24 subunit, subfamily, partial [Conexibacter sp.]|nr:polymerase, sigma-24 subunit, subfamily [Conexibacter sp.]
RRADRPNRRGRRGGPPAGRHAVRADWDDRRGVGKDRLVAGVKGVSRCNRETDITMTPSLSICLLATQGDARLLELARQGHERAFEALVQRYRRSLHSYCRRLLVDEQRAEDALQQALLQAWLALRAGTEVHEAKPWLHRIVHNTALNVVRANGRDHAPLSETVATVSAAEEDLDRRIAVRDTLAELVALPAMQREALLRTAVEGRSHEDVAAALGLSEGALRGLVYRARATLRGALTAVTPAPLAAWAANAAGRGGPVGGRLADLAVEGGSAGIGALAIKAGVVAVTAGVVGSGIAVVPARHHAAGQRATTRPSTHRDVASAAAPRAVAASPAATRDVAALTLAPTRAAPVAATHAHTGPAHPHSAPPASHVVAPLRSAAPAPQHRGGGNGDTTSGHRHDGSSPSPGGGQRHDDAAPRADGGAPRDDPSHSGTPSHSGSSHDTGSSESDHSGSTGSDTHGDHKSGTGRGDGGATTTTAQGSPTVSGDDGSSHGGSGGSGSGGDGASGTKPADTASGDRGTSSGDGSPRSAADDGGTTTTTPTAER